MTQLELEIAFRGLSRRSDPESSKRAARVAVAGGMVDEHSARILGALERCGGSMDSRELADATGLSVVQVCRRLGSSGALLARGLVRVVPRAGARLRWFAVRRSDS